MQHTHSKKATLRNIKLDIDVQPLYIETETQEIMQTDSALLCFVVVRSPLIFVSFNILRWQGRHYTIALLSVKQPQRILINGSHGSIKN